MGRHKANRFGTDPQDLVAARAIEAAGGTCSRCEGAGGSLVAERDGKGWRAVHLNRAACDRVIRDSLREDDS